MRKGTGRLISCRSRVPPHQTAAWTVCHELISSPEAPMAGRLLGAQTFKSKVIPPWSIRPVRTRWILIRSRSATPLRPRSLPLRSHTTSPSSLLPSEFPCATRSSPSSTRTRAPPRLPAPAPSLFSCASRSRRSRSKCPSGTTSSAPSSRGLERTERASPSCSSF